MGVAFSKDNCFFEKSLSNSPVILGSVERFRGDSEVVSSVKETLAFEVGWKQIIWITV